MTKEQINQCKIVRCMFIADKWKVIVEHNGKTYGFRIDGLSTDTDAMITNAVYTQLSITEIQVDTIVTPVITKETLVNTTPIEKVNKAL